MNIDINVPAISNALVTGAAALPRLIERTGRAVNSPKGQAIFAGAAVCAYGGLALVLAGHAAAPAIKRAARRGCDRLLGRTATPSAGGSATKAGARTKANPDMAVTLGAAAEASRRCTDPAFLETMRADMRAAARKANQESVFADYYA